jgi:hypothetical protein
MERHTDLTAAAKLTRSVACATGAPDAPLSLDNAAMNNTIGPDAEFGLR